MILIDSIINEMQKEKHNNNNNSTISQTAVVHPITPSITAAKTTLTTTANINDDLIVFDDNPNKLYCVNDFNNQSNLVVNKNNPVMLIDQSIKLNDPNHDSNVNMPIIMDEHKYSERKKLTSKTVNSTTTNNNNDISNNNQNNVKNKCNCKLNSNIFNCLICTKNYPINVRRSRDGESNNFNQQKKQQQQMLSKHQQAYLSDLQQFNNNNNMTKYQMANNINSMITSVHSDTSSTADESSSSSSSSSISNNNNNNNITSSYHDYHHIRLNLKPSPIPVSSTLISLLSLNSPNNKFIAPPNKSIAIFSNSNTKNSSNNISNHQYKPK
jgi:hypothetical protein